MTVREVVYDRDLIHKYEDAFDRIINDAYVFPRDHFGVERDFARQRDLELIHTLVRKETPMKRNETVSNAFCGNCGYAFGYNKVIEQRSLNFKHLQYCSCCGQKIDWSNEKGENK